MIKTPPSSHNKTCRKVKSKLNPVPQFQNMEGVSIEDDFEEGDVPMLSPAARQAAADKRRGADLPDTSHDFPGHSGDQLQGNLPQEGGDQVNGDANRPNGVAAPIIANGPIDNKRLRTALESLMTAYSMPITSTRLCWQEMLERKYSQP